MWKLLFLLLATAVSSEDLECRSRTYQLCEVGEEPRDMPGTEEELQEFCRFALKYLQCVNRIIEECDVDDMNVAHFREMNNLANRICVEDSLLYSALANSLPCIKKNQKLFTIPCEKNEGFATFSETLESVGVTDLEASDAGANNVSASDFEPRSCLRLLYNVGCFASNVGKLCGDVAREVVVDIIEVFEEPFESCPPGMKDNVGQIARVMQIEAEKGDIVENEIKKRK